MSYYDDSSLFVAPNGYKASVLFAQKPMDANGQLAFTRSNDTATRVASNGLIEKVRTNLATYSEQFNNAAWSKQEITVTANAAVAPDGTQSADKLIPTAVTGTHQITSATLTTLTQCAFSVFAKADGYNTITILDLSVASNGATFNVATGTVSTIFGTATASIVPYGNGWYRCIVVANTTGVRFYVPTSASNFTGDGTSGVLLWGAQVEAGDIATDYIATTSAARSVGPLANIPRIDYLGGGCGKLLLEPQRTNSITSSENISTGWTYTNTAISLNQTASPDGYVNADAIVPDATSGQHAINSVNITASGSFTLSAFVKAGEYTKVAIRESANTGSYASFNLATGTKIEDNVSGASFIQSYGNGWYRIGVTGTFSGTIRLGINVLSNAYTTGNPSSGTTFFSGNASNKLFCWGMQAELGATYATSYIPTLAASVTRGADACSKTGISSLIGQTEGTLFAEFQINANNTDLLNRIFSVSDGTLTSRVLIIANTDETFRFVVSVASTTVVNITTSASVLGGRHKVAFAYKANDFIAYVDGVQVGSNTAVSSVPASLTAAYVGTIEGGASAQVLEGTVSQAILFKTRLPNSELASMTTL